MTDDGFEEHVPEMAKSPLLPSHRTNEQKGPERIWAVVICDLEAGVWFANESNRPDVTEYIRADRAPTLSAGSAERLREAAKALADYEEQIARNSYAHHDGSWPQDWIEEDPDGYALWKAVVDALGIAEGEG